LAAAYEESERLPIFDSTGTASSEEKAIPLVGIMDGMGKVTQPNWSHTMYLAKYVHFMSLNIIL